MRKNTRTAAVIIAVLLTLAFATSALANDETTGLELASLVPPDALVYMEVKDLAALLGTVLDTRFATEFPKATAYRDFTTSKLYNKLRDRIAQLEETTGFGLSLKNFQALAGGRSAFALYDIGELQFIFLSRIGAEKAAASALWNLRDTFDERIVEGGELHYYVMEDEYGSVALAFALAGDLLVVGTDAARFEACLSLINGNGDALAAADAFSTSFPADLRLEDAFLYLDQKKIAETPYFGNYWIYGNEAELEDISTAAISLHIAEDELWETRWISREKQPSALPGGIDLVAAALPEAADYYEYGSVVGAVDCAGLVADEFFDEVDAGLKKDLSVVLAAARPDAWGIAMKAETGADGFFSVFRKVMALHLNTAQSLDRAGLERALSGYFERKLLYGGAGSFSFIDRSGTRVLDVPLFEVSAPAYKMNGSVLLIGTGTDFVGSASGTNPAQQSFISSKHNLASAAWFSLRNASERLIPYLEALAGRSNWRSSGNAGFFSGNVVSLLKQLDVLKAITVKRSLEDGKIVESVTYSFRK